jgi:hypothetical protein
MLNFSTDQSSLKNSRDIFASEAVQPFPGVPGEVVKQINASAATVQIYVLRVRPNLAVSLNTEVFPTSLIANITSGTTIVPKKDKYITILCSSGK